MQTELVNDIQIVRCERGDDQSRTPTRGEWEAQYVFVLAPPPSNDWRQIFKENLRAKTFNDDWAKLAYGDVRDERFGFFCHPDQLQRHADKLKEIVAATNSDYSDLLAAGDKTDGRRREFEAAAEGALRALEL